VCRGCTGKLRDACVVGLLALGAVLICAPAASPRPHAARVRLSPSPSWPGAQARPRGASPYAYDCRGWQQVRVRSAPIAIALRQPRGATPPAGRAGPGHQPRRSASATLGIDLCKPNAVRRSGRYARLATVNPLTSIPGQRHRGVAFPLLPLRLPLIATPRPAPLHLAAGSGNPGAKPCRSGWAACRRPPRAALMTRGRPAGGGTPHYDLSMSAPVSP